MDAMMALMVTAKGIRRNMEIFIAQRRVVATHSEEKGYDEILKSVQDWEERGHFAHIGQSGVSD
jgi:hypothetical protein